MNHDDKGASRGWYDGLAVKLRKTVLLVLGCGSFASVPAVATAAIRPSLLVARPRDIPGFYGAKHSLRSATSAVDYAQLVLGDGPAETHRESLHLTREGFEEGTTEFFSDTHGEAVSDALVFSSARGAKQELTAAVSEDIHAHHEGRFTVALIPGSVGFSSFKVGHLGASADVLFSIGRCYLEVGNAVPGASTRTEGIRAPITGAMTLYRRVKHLCT